MSKSLFRSTSTVASMTLVSRIAGFLRDMVTAQLFGAGAAFDAFSIAFRIPNLMRRLFAEGSFSQAFVPVLSEYQKQRTPAETKDFINAIAGTLGIVLLGVTVMGVILSPWIIRVFAPGFAPSGARFAYAISMLRITFPYLMLISLTAFCGAILNTYSRFWVAAFTPIWLNVCMITAALYLSPRLHIPIMALAVGVLVAGFVQLFFQLPFLWRLRLMPRPAIRFNDPGVMRVLKLMVPAIFGVSVFQINVMVDTLFASLLVVGSVSWLYYSDRLMEFPLGVIGVAISTVILPHLSRHHASEAHQDFSQTIDWALRCVLLVGIPAAVVFAIIAGPLLSTLFQRGHFTPEAVFMTRKSLSMFAIGITPFMLVKILAAGFYARQDMGTPVRIGLIAMVSNMILNALLFWPFKHAGIALATSLSAIINSGFLLILLQRRGFYLPRVGWRIFGARVCAANALMAVWLWFSAGNLQQWVTARTLWRVEHLAVVLVGAGIVYLLGLFVVGMRPRHVLMAGG